MSREVTVTTPPSRSPRAWNGEGEVLGVVPLLGAQGRKEEAKVSLVAPEDVGPAEAEAVILARTPDEPLRAGSTRQRVGRASSDLRYD